MGFISLTAAIANRYVTNLQGRRDGGGNQSKERGVLVSHICANKGNESIEPFSVMLQGEVFQLFLLIHLF